MLTDLTLDLREDMPTLPDLPTFEAETIRTHEEHGYLARWFGTKAHQGTHLDAPAHYVEDGRTVDQIPLSTLWGPASVLDVRDASGGAVTESDLDAAAPPEQLHGFLAAFSLMVFGEFGDKTQIITIGLAAQYGATAAIWVGEMLAIVPVSLVTALFFHRTAHRLDQAWFHRLAAALFFLFTLDIGAKYVVGVSLLP
jgi:putative Ca2+/H+ antiporter (TMEM165/GDT1 family)